MTEQTTELKFVLSDFVLLHYLLETSNIGEGVLFLGMVYKDKEKKGNENALQKMHKKNKKMHCLLQ